MRAKRATRVNELISSRLRQLYGAVTLFVTHGFHMLLRDYLSDELLYSPNRVHLETGAWLPAYRSGRANPTLIDFVKSDQAPLRDLQMGVATFLTQGIRWRSGHAGGQRSNSAVSIGDRWRDVFAFCNRIQRFAVPIARLAIAETPETS